MEQIHRSRTDVARQHGRVEKGITPRNIIDDLYYWPNTKWRGRNDAYFPDFGSFMDSEHRSRWTLMNSSVRSSVLSETTLTAGLDS